MQLELEDFYNVQNPTIGKWYMVGSKRVRFIGYECGTYPIFENKDGETFQGSHI